jgi:dynein heavy chain
MKKFLGKTVIVNDKLQSLNNELWTVVNVPFNYYTTSEMLQSILEKPLERKAGRNYGPPGNKRLVYFIGKKINKLFLKKNLFYFSFRTI